MASRALGTAALASAAALAAGAAVAGAGSVVVDPTVGTPDTAFDVAVPATFPVRQPLRDRYWFVVHGPGGAQCDGTVIDRVGVTPPAKAKTVSVALPGVRAVSKKGVEPGPWCPGSFSGHVEFRDWRPRTRRYVVHRIGTIGFQVQSGQ